MPTRASKLLLSALLQTGCFTTAVREDDRSTTSETTARRAQPISTAPPADAGTSGKAKPNAAQVSEPKARP